MERRERVMTTDNVAPFADPIHFEAVSTF